MAAARCSSGTPVITIRSSGARAVTTRSSGARAATTRSSGERAARIRPARRDPTMLTAASSLVRTHLLHPGVPVRRRARDVEPAREAFGWQALPRGAQVYVAGVIAAGAFLVAAFFPHDYPHPLAVALL